jgi:O-antigen ligase
MQEILFNPIIIVLALGVLVPFLLLLFQMSKTEKVAKKIEDVAVFIFLICLAEVSLPGFSQLRPRGLVGLDKTLGSAIAQIGVYLFFIILLRGRLRDFFQNLTLVFKDPFLLPILILTLLSAFWSETPDYTFNGSLVIVGTSLFAVQIAKHYSISQLESILRWLCAFILTVGVVISIAIPSMGVNEKGWIGIMGFPIRTGTFAALSIVLWGYHTIQHPNRPKYLNIMIILISLLALVRSNSAQAVIVLICLLGISTIQYLVKHLKFRQATAISIFIFTLTVCLFVSIKLNVTEIFDYLGKDTTLTGRTDFWPQIISTLNQHNPLLGFGVYGFWQPWRGAENPARYIINPNGFVPPNAHSGFLDLALEIGWLGLLLFICSFLKVTQKSLLFAVKDRSSEAMTPIILVVYILMANISETQLFSDVYIWFLYIFLAVSPELRKRYIDNHFYQPE